MNEVLNNLPLQEDICNALKGESNQLKESLDLTIALERGNWQSVSQ